MLTDTGPDLHAEAVVYVPARLRELAATPADLSRELPLRAHLVTGPGGEQALLLALHYLGADEWSVVPLLRDLGTAYAARRDGRAPEWAPLPVSYGDYARWAQEVLGDESNPDSRHARQLGHWREALAGAPAALDVTGSGGTHGGTRSDTDGTRGDTGGDDDPSSIMLFEIEPELHRAVAELARASRTSMFMVLQGALAAVLTADGAGTDLPIGSFAAGRTEPALGDLVGCVVDIVLMRTDTSGDPSFATLLSRIREADLAALDHQDVAFADVAAATGLDRPRVLLVHHEEARLDAEQSVLGRLEAIHPGSSSSDVTVAFYESPGEAPVTCTLTHRTAVLDPAAAAELAERLLAVLRRATGDPGQPLSRLTA